MTYESAVAALAPKLFWKFNETSGTVATDSGSWGNNLTYISSPTLNQAGLYPGGSSVLLAGTSCQISGTATNYTSITAGTACGWIKYVGSPDSGTLFTNVFSGGHLPLVLGGAQIPGSTAGKINAGSYSGSWNVTTSATGTATGTVYFLALTTTKSGTSQLYVNGSPEGTPVATGAWSGVNNTINIGARWDASGAPYANAYVAGVAFWDSVLSSAQIASLYSAASGGGGGTPGKFEFPTALRRQAVIRAASY